MKHYIRKKLVKEVNNLYFREFDNHNIFPVKEDMPYFELNDIYTHLERIKADRELLAIVNDLLCILEGSTNYESDVAHKCMEFCEHYNFKIINSTFPKEVQDVSWILAKISPEACLVGGAVRDICIDRSPKDFDFCTNTNINTLEKTFKENGYKVDSVGKAFLVLIVTKNGFTFEIANFRKDRDNSGGEVGNIYDDAQRRDFTIGAGYFNIRRGEIVDPNGTFFEDINSRTLRFVNKAKDRIVEDSARVFRFYRFIDRGFNPDPKSLRACRDNFEYAVNNTNAERIKNELEKIVLKNIKV